MRARSTFSLAASGQQVRHIAPFKAKTAGGDAESNMGLCGGYQGQGGGRLRRASSTVRTVPSTSVPALRRPAKLAAAQQVGQGRVQAAKVQRPQFQTKRRQGRGHKGALLPEIGRRRSCAGRLCGRENPASRARRPVRGYLWAAQRCSCAASRGGRGFRARRSGPPERGRVRPHQCGPPRARARPRP